MTGGTLCTRA